MRPPFASSSASRGRGCVKSGASMNSTLKPSCVCGRKGAYQLVAQRVGRPLDPVPSPARYHPLVRDALALPSKMAMALAVLGVAVVIRVVRRERTRRREHRQCEPAPLIER